MNRKKMALIGGGVLLLVLVGVAVAKGGDKGVPVQIATVGRENLVSKVSANGKVQAVKKADISANLVGQVTRLAVKEGDVVKKGQFLMEIDPRSAKASTEASQAGMQAILSDLASAQANLVQARADFERAKRQVEAHNTDVQVAAAVLALDLNAIESSLKANIDREAIGAALERARS